MTVKVMKKDRLNELLCTLLVDYTVIAPKNEQNDVCFSIVNKPEEVNLSFPNTTVSAKEFFLPQSEPLLKYRIKNKVPKFSTIMPPDEKRLIFGIRPCDAAALIAIDKPYQEKFSDSQYNKRRAQTVVVTFACNRACSEYAFCHSMKAGPYARKDFDIQMYDIGNLFLVESGSERGNTLIADNSHLFSDATDEHIQIKDSNMANAEATFTKNVSLENVSKNLDTFFEADEMWTEHAKKCIHCGGCNYICPTCHCFNVTDYTESNGEGVRVRNWDSCMLAGFARMTGPHHVRKHSFQRLRQRIYHKFHIFPERFDMFGCTGCGRCIASCPVGVDLTNIVNTVNSKR